MCELDSWRELLVFILLHRQIKLPLQRKLLLLRMGTYLGKSLVQSSWKLGRKATFCKHLLLVKSMTLSSFEADFVRRRLNLLHMSRLASMESICDSLANELVKMTVQCEKLHGEAAVLPGLRSELEALRRRHSAALELMGECDEELQEIRIAHTHMCVERINEVKWLKRRDERQNISDTGK
ncbi:golgin candidate 5-like [Vigna umbellata]|uniref:golgin candidate 5-like n=1 Tax=Vigna umbellata TaxID=87088 RepID=UPI001F5E7113|nr:golgin candidate 5-like [Vigna umbellata]